MAKKEFFISNKKKIIFLLFIIFICTMHFIISFERMPKDPRLINEMKEEFNYLNKEKEKFFEITVITNELIKKYIYPGMGEQEALINLMLFFNEKIEHEKIDEYHIYRVYHFYDRYKFYTTKLAFISIECIDKRVKYVHACVKLTFY